MPTEKSIKGCILGTAAGDALGLSCEGLSKQRQIKLFPDLNKYHFFFNKGMVSDDTEHTCIAAQALIVSAGNTKKFVSSLAWRLRFWLMGLPAGIGYATLRSIIKLWLFFPPDKSGVFSAGNGPAMRSAIIGVCYGEDSEKFKELVKISTRITHSDPKAEYGALAVALAAHMAANSNEKDLSLQEYYQELEKLLPEQATEFLNIINKTLESISNGQTTEKYAEECGFNKGVSGYIYHTVPVVIHCWLRNQNNFRAGITEVIRCGGDTDTTAAILGGIIGARTGKEGIPAEWISNLFEWPCTVNWMEQIAARLTLVCNEQVPHKSVPHNFIGVFIRNIFFMIIVLIHGFRRALPPY